MSPLDYKSFLALIENGGETTEQAGEIETKDLPTQLEDVTGKAITKSQEILNFPLDPHDEHFGLVLRAQTAVINSALNTQAKVDENRLRARRIDVLPRLLEMIKEEKQKMIEQGLIVDFAANEEPPENP
jgi:hypothetical protein